MIFIFINAFLFMLTCLLSPEPEEDFHWFFKGFTVIELAMELTILAVFLLA